MKSLRSIHCTWKVSESMVGCTHLHEPPFPRSIIPSTLVRTISEFSPLGLNRPALLQGLTGTATARVSLLLCIPPVELCQSVLMMNAPFLLSRASSRNVGGKVLVTRMQLKHMIGLEDPQ